MIDSLSDPKFWIVSFLLITAIWINNRNTRRNAYRLGVVRGFALGIESTAKAMLDEHIVNKTNASGYRVNKSELVEYITPIITAKLAKQLQ